MYLITQQRVLDKKSYKGLPSYNNFLNVINTYNTEIFFLLKGSAVKYVCI